MIVVDKPKLKFLLAGRTITVTVNSDRYKRGRSYAVGTAHNKASTCTATVLGIRVTDSGRELEIVQNKEGEERYLSRSVARGYTTKPEEAIPDEGATALSRGDLKHMAGANQRRFEREQRDELVLRQARSISTKLRDAARVGDAERVRKLRRELSDLARRMEAA